MSTKETTPISEKTAKFLGKFTAKTVSATGSLTGKTVNTIKVTPSKTSEITKNIANALAEGYREVRPAEDEAEITPAENTDTTEA